jgi:hypothetical protein
MSRFDLRLVRVGERDSSGIFESTETAQNQPQGATMTTRALATKLRRLESLAKMHPRWHDAVDASPPVVFLNIRR